MLRKIIIQSYALLSTQQRRKGMVVCILMVIQSALDVLNIAVFLPVLMLIVDPAITGREGVVKTFYSAVGFSSHGSFVIFLATSILVFMTIKSIISVWITKVKGDFVFEIGTDLANQTIDRYLGISYLDFAQADFSREINRIASDPIAFANNIILPLTVLISEGLVAISLFAGIAYFDLTAFALSVAMLVPAVLVFQTRKRKLKDISVSLKEMFPRLLKNTQQAIEAFPEIRIFGKEDFFTKRFSETSKSIAKTFVKEHAIQSGTTRVTEVIVVLTICLLILYSIMMRKAPQETLLLLGLYAGASFRLVPSVNRILLSLQQIRSNEHLAENLDIRRNLKVNEKSSLAPEFNESIRLDQVSFAYPEGPTILDNISLTITKGDKIAITGDSGEGKTTLLLILTGLLARKGGQIFVDDVLVEGLRWNKLIGFVPQNPYILDSSLAENIAFGIPRESIDRTRVSELVSALDLSDLIRDLPAGLDTGIGERGAKLSGGQRQRIALARALYLDPDILVLDEVTNQIHESLESDIMTMLASRGNGKTIIVVTHKISNLNFFNSVYRISQGKILKA